MNPNTKESFAPLFEQSKRSDIFWEELAILSFTGSVLERLKAQGLTKKNLADLLKVSPAYVTKLMGGGNNFTLRTMVKIARILKSELKIELQSAIATCRSFDYSEAEIAKPLSPPTKKPANDYEDLALAA